MEYSEIQKLINSMGESKLTELDIAFSDGTKIIMKKKNQEDSSIQMSNKSLDDTTVASNIKVEEKNIVNNNLVKSPMVGTFYSKSNPTAECFVSEGDKIEKGQTLCIIEAMKLMNEIESEYSGIVKKIFVKDGEMVEYAQPLFEIE